MKKVRILLIVITAVAVAMGIGAFKVKHESVYCGTQNARAGSQECLLNEY
jgi:hypothetical protein